MFTQVLDDDLTISRPTVKLKINLRFLRSLKIWGAHWFRRDLDSPKSMPRFVCVTRKTNNQIINANSYELGHGSDFQGAAFA